MGTPKVFVVGSTVSASQLKDLFRQIEDGSINGKQIQAFLDHCDPFGVEDVQIDWVKVYDALGLNIRGLYIKKDDHPLYWSVPVAYKVTPNLVVTALERLGVAVYKCVGNLDEETDTVDPIRDPKHRDQYPTFLKSVEADLTFRGKSASAMTGAGFKGITLLERLLLELGYFMTTGKHLDMESTTVCSGSRYRDGTVPIVKWSMKEGGLWISHWDRDNSHYQHGVRAVVL